MGTAYEQDGRTFAILEGDDGYSMSRPTAVIGGITNDEVTRIFAWGVEIKRERNGGRHAPTIEVRI